jgi:hypothetical protein
MFMILWSSSDLIFEKNRYSVIIYKTSNFLLFRKFSFNIKNNIIIKENFNYEFCRKFHHFKF